nr:MAG TPA: hypothetical protein [Caudoviricetes sp.]
MILADKKKKRVNKYMFLFCVCDEINFNIKAVRR